MGVLGTDGLLIPIAFAADHRRDEELKVLYIISKDGPEIGCGEVKGLLHRPKEIGPGIIHLVEITIRVNRPGIGQEAVRLEWFVEFPDFKMQMRAGRIASLTDQGNRLALRNGRASCGQDAGCVGIEG